MSIPSKRAPYTPDELYAQASKLAGDWNIPPKWREDAVQEFVIAAVESAGKAMTSVCSCQHRSGKNAMLNFLRREERAEGRTPAGCPANAKRISLDRAAPGMDGEPTVLAETVVDHATPAPDAGMIADDLKKAVTHAWTRLTAEESEAARRVFVEAQTQTAAAGAMGLTRDQLRGRLASALPILRVWLAEYRAMTGE